MRTLILLLLLCMSLFAESAESKNREGNRILKNALKKGRALAGKIDPQKKDPFVEEELKELSGDFEKALKTYDEGLVIDPEENRLHYNAGNAQYFMGKFDDAIKDYDKAIEGKHEDIKKNAYFNRGNAKVRSVMVNPNQAGAKEKLESAIDDYKKTLSFDQGDLEAKANIEITRKIMDRLEEMQKQQQEQQKDQDKQNQDKQKQDQNKDQQDNKDEENKDQQDQKKDQDNKQDQDKKDKQDEQDQSQGDKNKEEKDQQPQPQDRQQKQGEMTPREAKALLDAFKDDEKEQMKKKLKGVRVRGAEKDW